MDGNAIQANAPGPTGYATYSHTLLFACLLITAGAVLAASDLLFRRGG